MSNKLDYEATLLLCERSFNAALHSLKSKQTVNRCLIAHSGGVDSQVLLHLAARSLPSDQLVVVHINHHLQKQSDDWAEFSRFQAEGLKLKSLVIDVFPDSSSENSARQARYDALAGLVKEGDVVLFGHHADDQTETLLYRMLRGTGLAGMRGIPVSRPLAMGMLLRPLLALSREQIERVAEGLGLEYINDPSNQSDDYDRNYLRNQIVPRLKHRWPKTVQRWYENARLFEAEGELLESYLDADLKHCTTIEGQFDLCEWNRFEQNKQNALLRHWFYRSLNLRVNSSMLDQMIKDVVCAGIDADPEYQLEAQVFLRRFQQKLYLVYAYSDCTEELLIQTNGRFQLGDGCLYIQGLPTDCVLKMVRRKGGEQCRPIGRARKSVKKILQEVSIPPWQRERWPLLYVDDKLIAIPGVCLCQESGFKENQNFSVLWRPFSLSDNS
ncbi:MAG: tRNA lysidine(34) synthetase TilS [Neptuniibacter sp.]